MDDYYVSYAAAYHSVYVNHYLPATSYYFVPKSPNDSFLVMDFWLHADVNASELDSNDVLFVLDGVQAFRPVGVGSSAAFNDNGYCVGNLTGSIPPQGTARLVVRNDDVNYSLSVDYFNATSKKFTFVYITSNASLDGTHLLQMRIAGSNDGPSFTPNHVWFIPEFDGAVFILITVVVVTFAIARVKPKVLRLSKLRKAI